MALGDARQRVAGCFRHRLDQVFATSGMKHRLSGAGVSLGLPVADGLAVDRTVAVCGGQAVAPVAAPVGVTVLVGSAVRAVPIALAEGSTEPAVAVAVIVGQNGGVGMGSMPRQVLFASSDSATWSSGSTTTCCSAAGR